MKTKHIVIILSSYPLIIFLPLVCCAKKKEDIIANVTMSAAAGIMSESLRMKRDIATKKVEKFDNILETMPDIGQYISEKKKRRVSF